MKTPSNTKTMPSSEACPDVMALAEIFDMSPELIVALNDCYPDHREWYFVRDSIGRQLAQMKGYPFTEGDQQPYDIAYTFPRELSDEFAMRLYWLWASSIVHHCAGKDIDAINHHVRLMNVRLTYLLGDSIAKNRQRDFLDSILWINALRIQHGLHDIPSGQLPDRDEYSLRHLILDLSGLNEEGMIITGDMLDTADLKLALFGRVEA